MSASFCLPSTHVAPQVPLWKALIILAWAREKERCDFFCVSSRKKKKKKSAKINIFVSMVQPREKYEHIGEEIKMMDLLADMCVCFVCLMSRVCAFGLCRVSGRCDCCIVCLARARVVFWTVRVERYHPCVIAHLWVFGVYVKGAGWARAAESGRKTCRQCEAPGNHLRLQAEGLIRQLAIHQAKWRQ